MGSITATFLDGSMAEITNRIDGMLKTGTGHELIVVLTFLPCAKSAGLADLVATGRPLNGAERDHELFV